MTRRVLRYEVPVDDQPHEIAAGGPVVLVAPQRDATGRRAGTGLPDGLLEVWVETPVLGDGQVPLSDPRAGQTLTPVRMRKVQVFGTGHSLPSDGVWLGSCLDGPLVWHVYELLRRGEGS